MSSLPAGTAQGGCGQLQPRGRPIHRRAASQGTGLAAVARGRMVGTSSQPVSTGPKRPEGGQSRAWPDLPNWPSFPVCPGAQSVCVWAGSQPEHCPSPFRESIWAQQVVLACSVTCLQLSDPRDTPATHSSCFPSFLLRCCGSVPHVYSLVFCVPSPTAHLELRILPIGSLLPPHGGTRAAPRASAETGGWEELGLIQVGPEVQSAQ